RVAGLPLLLMPGSKHVFSARLLEDAGLFGERFQTRVGARSGDRAPTPEAKEPPGRRRPGSRVRGWPGAFRERVVTTAVSTVVVSSAARAPDLNSGSNRFDSCTTRRAENSVPGARKRT